MLLTAIAAIAISPLNPSLQEGSKPIRQVAILPWALKDGTDTAMTTAKDTVKLLFEKSNFEVVPEVRAKTVWEEDLKMKPFKQVLQGDDAMPDLPTPKDLLALGKQMNVDLVCAGKAAWHTKSVWVTLGPKTKADCTVSVLIIDVKKEEVVLDAKDVKSDSTRKEKGLETAGALLISFGITAVSGGPKTPHQQKAAQNAIALAMEPWLRTAAAQNRKIGG